MKSVWNEDITMPSFPDLQGSIKTDVLIIGGGMAGILCAYYLQKSGVDYILVEGEKIGCGITKNTTAVITAQHDILYSKLIKQSGEEKAKQYLHANLRAVNEFRALSRTIECDFEESPSFIYSLSDKSKIENEVFEVNRLGFEAEFVKDIPLPFPIVGGVKFPSMAQFHPLKFIAGISKGLNIYENTFVNKLTGTVAYTDKGVIFAKRVIVATHFPFINSHGMYFMKLYQQRSYVIALENADEIRGTYVDDAENGMYFRNYQNLLLIGGGDHRTGKNGGNFDELRLFAKRHYPNAVKKYCWATQDCMSLDGIPYIGQYSKSLPNVFVAAGFNEWGMTSSMVGAFILADIISGKKNEFAEVFSPDRSIFKKQLFVNLGVTLSNFIIPTTKRCPHLGCALRRNKTEHTWDCSCHGSRFDEDGSLIDNPAMRDSHVK